jgi:hypothetical protein
MPAGIEVLTRSTNTKQYTFSNRLKNTVETSKAEVALVARFKAMLRHLIEAVISAKQQFFLLPLALVWGRAPILEHRADKAAVGLVKIKAFI